MKCGHMTTPAMVERIKPIEFVPNLFSIWRATMSFLTALADTGWGWIVVLGLWSLVERLTTKKEG